MSKRVELLALETLPRIMPGDDLAGLILAACDREGAGPLPDDVLVVAQKIVSKAEVRIVRLTEVESSPEALRLARISGKDPRIVELILHESEEIVRCVPGLIIARHRFGVVLANAGIDQLEHRRGRRSSRRLCFWPLDPDGQRRPDLPARDRRAARDEDRGDRQSTVSAAPGAKCTIGAAIGLAGLAGVVDLRGHADLFGRKLQSTEVGQADEIAAAASLVMGQADEGRPVVIVRGLSYPQRAAASAREITRERKLDRFPYDAYPCARAFMRPRERARRESPPALYAVAACVVRRCAGWRWLEIFRRLSAGDDEAAAEDEARHAVDAGFLGAVLLAILDAIHVGVAGKEPAHQVAVQWMADVRYGVVSRSAIDLTKSRSCSINSRPMRLSWPRFAIRPDSVH